MAGRRHFLLPVSKVSDACVRSCGDSREVAGHDCEAWLATSRGRVGDRQRLVVGCWFLRFLDRFFTYILSYKDVMENNFRKSGITARRALFFFRAGLVSLGDAGAGSVGFFHQRAGSKSKRTTERTDGRFI